MRDKTKSLLALAVSMALIAETVNAEDWIGDFYTSAGAGMNVTQPQAISTQNVVGYSGGGMSWRVPNKNFQVFQVTPPSLKAGCGGIDFYLGAYSFPNKAAFVNAMRNFGQASVGYFFNLALKTMAPEIESTLAYINGLATDINNFGRGNCALAKKAVDSIADALYTATEKDTSGGQVANGTEVDMNAAEQTTQTDGYWETVRKRYRQLTGKSPGSLSKQEVAKTDLPSRNVLFWALSKADSAGNMTEYEKYLIMSLIGPSLIVKGTTDTDGEGAPVDDARGSTITFKQLAFGDVDPNSGAPAPVKMLICRDSGYECLDVDDQTEPLVPFANRIQTVINKVKQGVASRNAPTFTTMEQVVLRVTSLPISRAAAMSETGGVGASVVEGLLPKLRDAAALEAATNFVRTHLNNAERAIVGSSAGNKQGFEKEVQRIETRIAEIKKEMAVANAEFYAHNKPFEIVEQLQLTEKYMYSNLNTMLAANARFKNRN